MARVVVCGYMVRYPLAGNVLAYLQYVLGLSRLGHEVLYLEESGWPGSCYNPVTNTCSDDPDYGLWNIRSLLSALGADARVAYHCRDSGRLYGTTWSELQDFLRESDLLLNIGGVCWMPDFLLCRRRALVDMDPFFTQVGKMGVEGFNQYHSYFSYGANIGARGCSIPTRNIHWHAAVPPVVCELWPRCPTDNAAELADSRPFTTIANWSAYGSVTYDGELYGQKDIEFDRIAGLPQRTTHKLELALSGAGPATVSRLTSAGWSVRSSLEVSLQLEDYQRYITGSRGEFSVAKNAYVKTRSGWFSDRSVCYLAAGRPVILQDSGFTDWLPAGRGVLAFSSIEEAGNCLEDAHSNYLEHAEAAREIAESQFGYRQVLARLVGIASQQ